jgi:hypothetical protein
VGGPVLVLTFLPDVVRTFRYHQERTSGPRVTVTMSVPGQKRIMSNTSCATTTILIPHQDDSVDVRFVSCGRLRCSATAATHLRNALDASLKMLEQPVPNPVRASKLN